jgi:hypothetical protein
VRLELNAESELARIENGTHDVRRIRRNTRRDFVIDEPGRVKSDPAEIKFAEIMQPTPDIVVIGRMKSG